MKFLCMACEEAMSFEDAAGPDEGSVTVVFRCKDCGAGVALLTNPGETRLVQALGVKIGGRTVEPQPFEAADALLGTSGAIPWTPQAEERLTRVPEFVRPMARAAIERSALADGATEVTEEHVLAAGHSPGPGA